MNNTSINQALRNAESMLSTAEFRFDDKKRELDLKTTKNINLLGPTALREVTDIVKEIKKLLEDLYATCQTQVRILDEVCRPLLNDTVPVAEVRDIWQMIARLNSKSDISVDFTASLNCANLGDIAVVTYSPTLQNKMIESYWEATYKGWNGREEFEKAERLEEEKRKEERKQALENIVDKEEQQYAKDLAEWQQIETAMLNKREKKLKDYLYAERKNITKKIEDNFRAKEKLLVDAKEKYLKERTDAEKALSETTSVNLIKRGSLKKTIKKLTAQIEDTQKQIDETLQAFEEEKNLIEKNLKERESEIQKKLKKEYPIPRKPRKPLKMRDANPSPSTLVWDGYKNNILNRIEKRGKISAMDLYDAFDLTYKNAKLILSQLEKEGEIETTSDSTNDNPCYKLIER